MPEETKAAPADKKGEGDSARTAKQWLDAIETASKYQAKYQDRVKKIVDVYSKQGDAVALGAERRFAIFWANIEVLKQATYTRQPQPAIVRRFSDRDPIARHVSETMQRSVTSIFDLSDVHDCLKSVRDDFLLGARGTAWMLYRPTFEKKTFVEGDEPIDVITDETLEYDFVHWADFIHPKAKRWKDLPWLGRRVYMTNEEGEARFGKEKWDKVRVHANIRAAAARITETSYTGKSGESGKVCIYEIWSKTDKKVYWIAKDYKEDFLDEKPPLFDLKDFWPCPRPVYGTMVTDSLIPIPDYVFYQDQAEEIDDLTKRIGALTDALKLTGFYPAGAEGGVSDAIERALRAGGDNEIVPVPSWAAFQSKGGIGKLVEWLPVDMVLKVLQGCIELRKQLIEDIYQITGISDIQRGDTNPSETLGAQQMKAQWGGLRMEARQGEMSRFAKDLTHMSAEVVAEVFQPETIWRMTGLKFPTTEEKQALMARAQQAAQPQAQGQLPAMMTGAPNGLQPPQPLTDEEKRTMDLPTQEEIVALLRDEGMRSYRIDVETASTIQPDETAEKAKRNEFLGVVATFMEQALPAAQQQPELVPVLGEMLMFAVRGYRAGRQLEDVIQEAVDSLAEAAKNAQQAQAQPQQPPPDPAMLKVQGELKLNDQKMKMEGLAKAAKLKLEQAQAIEGRMAEGLPDGLSFMDITAQLEEASRQLSQTTSQLDANFEAAMEAIRQIAEQQVAPAEVIRDESGRAVQIVKGNVTREVIQGPDGRVIGMQ